MSLGSAHNEVDDLDSHAALTLHRWVIPKAWPQFLTRLSCHPNDTVRNYFAESDSTRIQILESLACQVDQKLQTNLDSKASHHDHDSTVAHFTEVDWVRCCFSLPTRFVGTADTRLSFINYCGLIDCLSPRNLQTKEFRISLKFQRIDYAYGHWHQGRVYFESVVANLRAHGWG